MWMQLVNWYGIFIIFAIGSPVVGVGFTGTLATSRPKLGEHRYNFIANIDM